MWAEDLAKKILSNPFSRTDLLESLVQHHKIANTQTLSEKLQESFDSFLNDLQQIIFEQYAETLRNKRNATHNYSYEIRITILISDDVDLDLIYGLLPKVLNVYRNFSNRLRKSIQIIEFKNDAFNFYKMQSISNKQRERSQCLFQIEAWRFCYKKGLEIKDLPSRLRSTDSKDIQNFQCIQRYYIFESLYAPYMQRILWVSRKFLEHHTSVMSYDEDIHGTIEFQHFPLEINLVECKKILFELETTLFEEELIFLLTLKSHVRSYNEIYFQKTPFSHSPNFENKSVLLGINRFEHLKIDLKRIMTRICDFVPYVSTTIGEFEFYVDYVPSLTSEKLPFRNTARVKSSKINNIASELHWEYAVIKYCTRKYYQFGLSGHEIALRIISETRFGKKEQTKFTKKEFRSYIEPLVGETWLWRVEDEVPGPDEFEEKYEKIREMQVNTFKSGTWMRHARFKVQNLIKIDLMIVFDSVSNNKGLIDLYLEQLRVPCEQTSAYTKRIMEIAGMWRILPNSFIRLVEATPRELEAFLDSVSSFGTFEIFLSFDELKNPLQVADTTITTLGSCAKLEPDILKKISKKIIYSEEHQHRFKIERCIILLDHTFYA